MDTLAPLATRYLRRLEDQNVDYWGTRDGWYDDDGVESRPRCCDDMYETEVEEWSSSVTSVVIFAFAVLVVGLAYACRASKRQRQKEEDPLLAAPETV